jgi:hypothetical protein
MKINRHNVGEAEKLNRKRLDKIGEVILDENETNERRVKAMRIYRNHFEKRNLYLARIVEFTRDFIEEVKQRKFQSGGITSNADGEEFVIPKNQKEISQRNLNILNNLK